MVSDERWQFAQKAERRYQQHKADTAEFGRLEALMVRKSRYLVELARALDLPLNETQTAVEIGSGSHGMIWRLPCRRRVAVDPLADFYFERFRSLQDNGTIVMNAGGESIPLEDNSADWVISENVLDHVRDPGQVLAEARRILKPDGVFYCSVDTHSLPWRIASNLYNGVFRAGIKVAMPAFPAHPHHFSRADVFDLAGQAGLKAHWHRDNAISSRAPGFKNRVKALLGKNEMVEFIARPAG